MADVNTHTGTADDTFEAASLSRPIDRPVEVERIIHAVKAFARVPLEPDLIEEGASALLAQIAPFTDERVLDRSHGPFSRDTKLALVNLEYRLGNVVAAVRNHDAAKERQRNREPVAFTESYRKELLTELREARFEGKRFLTSMSD